MGHDEFGRRALAVHGTEPAAEELPNGRAGGDGEVLQRALGDAAELDTAVVGRELAPHLLAIALGFAGHLRVE